MNTTILSQKLTSSNTQSNYAGFIDKLDLKPVGMSIEKLRRNLGGTSSFKYSYNKKLGTSLEITTPLGLMRASISYNKCISKLVTNPSMFSSSYDYIEFCSQFFTDETLGDCRVYRFDLTADYRQSYEEIRKGFHVPGKRFSAFFTMDGVYDTGIQIGKGDKAYKLYNRGKLDKLSDGVTRVEAMTCGGLTKSLTFERFFRMLSQNDFLTSSKNPLASCLLFDVSYPEIKPTNVSKLDRQKILESYIGNYGLHFTKLKLNKSRNFQRDFSQLYSQTMSKYQPSYVFQQGVKKWLEC